MRQSCRSCVSGHVGCVATPVRGGPQCRVSPGWNTAEKRPSRADRLRAHSLPPCTFLLTVSVVCGFLFNPQSMPFKSFFF